MNPSGTDTSQLSDRPEREKDTFLTAGIFFSFDRCLLMGDPRYDLPWILLWAELLRSVSLPTASLFPKKKDIANSSQEKNTQEKNIDNYIKWWYFTAQTSDIMFQEF
jgi:hypothetical protein